ncbi:MAG TPA: response regulator transcription factor [Gaiellaceae bacterium]|nr:response regulator transcription factor [Gaiellaceae bacterium]
MAGEPITVVVVEDNDVFRESLELLLGVVPDVEVVASVASGRSALDVCPRLQPDVVLLDYRLPELDGVETTAGIRTACPDAAVVVLTAEVASGEVEALLEAGAVACLTKDRRLEEIVGAIRDAAGRGAALR